MASSDMPQIAQKDQGKAAELSAEEAEEDAEEEQQEVRLGGLRAAGVWGFRRM